MHPSSLTIPPMPRTLDCADILFACPCAVATVRAPSLRGPAPARWRVTGGDPGARRFSALTQITRDNVHAPCRPGRSTPAPRISGHADVVGGLMYVTGGDVFALEPETGKQVWRFDRAGVSRRGVAYWPGNGTRTPRVYAGARWPAGGARRANRRTDCRIRQGGPVDLKAGIGGVDGPSRSIRRPWCIATC